MITEDFRTCPETGLRIHNPTAALVKWNVVTAILFLALGGFMGFLVVLTRWPSVHYLGMVNYYRYLTLHGIDALLVWIIFFEIALVHFTSAVLLNTRSVLLFAGWIAYALMLVGAVFINIVVLAGKADVMFTSYVPLKADAVYYLGVIIFAVGALTAFGHFFGNIMQAKRDGFYKHSLPLGTYGLAAASIIAVLTLAHGAVIMIPVFFWSMGLIHYIDPGTYRLIFWGLGHPSQQINVCAMVSVWYMSAAFLLDAKPLNEKLSRTAFVLYIFFINVASEHHLLVDPIFSAWHKIINTSYVMHLAVLASMMHAFSVPASIELALRKKGYDKSLFEWLKKAPWSNPSFSALAISILLFGFLGGITGVIFGTEQFNIIRHNTIAITGHFHGTVVAGTTVAFMGFTYLLIKYIFQRELVMQKLAMWQPWLYGIGVALISIGMMSAGSFGVPRRHYDITFSGAPFSFTFDPSIDMFMSMMGIGGVLATIGGVAYIVVALGSILYGRKINA
ncbi:MAG TPA: cytochrome C oxidase subunit I [Deltaproteobacteria bacterium]|nr:cytochrome C oxidase subunit I [Deltaproteobacteria bacterium]